ncbi:hypothetical protein [Fodinicola feengrottensis]|uniref:hypothetical protein n=1 Tax=Fodinicola feengrottensis TaxID=435914 RepID=UPI0013D010A5|nr:hypothetical protein [Fodinicola feengrottensis]
MIGNAPIALPQTAVEAADALGGAVTGTGPEAAGLGLAAGDGTDAERKAKKASPATTATGRATKAAVRAAPRRVGGRGGRGRHASKKTRC